MTTIIYKDGVMYADSRGWSGEPIPIGSKMKIRRLKDGSLVGASSASVGETDRFCAWLDGLPEHEIPAANTVSFDVAALIVRPDGRVYFFNSGVYPTGPLNADFYVTGSGEKYALALLHAGLPPIEALEITARLDPWTAGPFTHALLHE